MKMVATDFQDVASYVDAFEREGKRRDGEPSWLRELRSTAIERFAALGFPSPRDEDWKYTNVGPILRTEFQELAETGGASQLGKGALLGIQDFLPHGVMTNRLLFVDGQPAHDAWSLCPVPEGTALLSLADALERVPDAIEPHLGQLARWKDRPFTALNTALARDGAFVRLPPRVAILEPIVLVFVATAHALPRLANPRVLVVAEEDSHATVVEAWVGLEGGAPHWSNVVSEVALGPGATVEHYKIQLEDTRAFHLADVAIAQSRSSRATSCSISIGGALVRNEIDAALGAEGSECSMTGLYLARDRQHVDHHTLIDHAQPHCSSRELYHGVLDDEARGVFNGKIIVRKDAQKSDAHQVNKNLLLSEKAVVDTKPQLEIFANDVKCAHGAAVGRLDDEALFYLRSRGLDRQSARSLLTYGFATQVLDTITQPSLRARVERLVRTWLGEVGP